MLAAGPAAAETPAAPDPTTSVGEDGVPHHGSKAMAPAWKFGRSKVAFAADFAIPWSVAVGGLDGDFTMGDYLDPGLGFAMGLGIRHRSWAYTWRTAFGGPRASEAGKVGLAGAYGFAPDEVHGYLWKHTIAAEHRFYRGSSDLAPWLRFGLGLETQRVVAMPGDTIYSFNHASPLVAIGTGLDWRLTRTTGLGLYGDGSVGYYGAYNSKIEGYCGTDEGCSTPSSFVIDEQKIDFARPGVHSYVEAGLRLSVFP